MRASTCIACSARSPNVTPRRTTRGRQETMVPPGRYEIRIKGKLSATLQSTFEGMSAEFEPVETILSGVLEDQAALYGVLEHVQSLGLELVEVRRVASPELTVRPGGTRSKTDSQE